METTPESLFEEVCKILDSVSEQISSGQSSAKFRAKIRPYGVRIIVTVKNCENGHIIEMSKYCVQDRLDLILFGKLITKLCEGLQIQ